MDKIETATGIMFMQREENYKEDVRQLLNQDYISHTGYGFKIDVLRLIDTLKEGERNDIVRYIIAKYGYKNKS